MSVEELNLSNNLLSSESMTSLVKVLSNNPVTVLDLTNNNLSCEAAKTLAKYGNIHVLVALDVSVVILVLAVVDDDNTDHDGLVVNEEEDTCSTNIAVINGPVPSTF